MRVLYLRNLRKLIVRYGSSNIIYFDESGFKSEDYRPHGWAVRGKKIHGSICGNRRKAPNLIMAQRGKEWLAPMLFKASCTAQTVLAWLEKMLLKELTTPSVIIMDNAAFHQKEKIRALLESVGHTLLCLPPYSPDLNPIEQSFAVIKKRRQFFKGTNALEIILNGDL